MAASSSSPRFADTVVKAVRRWLPSPFTIAIVLTAITFLLAWLIHPEQDSFSFGYLFQLGEYWQNGFWGFLAFGMQMMLILVLGHTLALSPPVNRIIKAIIPLIVRSTASAAAAIAFLAIVAAWFNWGLGLIVGALLARKAGEYALQHNVKVNYGVIGAAGYAGLMVWHGGLSGSAPLKVAEPGHKLESMMGVVPASETLFSPMNLVVTLLIFSLLPLVMYLVGRSSKPSAIPRLLLSHSSKQEEEPATGAEKIDRSAAVAWIIGGIMVLLSLRTIFVAEEAVSLAFLNLNYINFLLFGLGLLFHSSIFGFMKAAREAIVGATGILIQFPLYAGIMGIMSGSGLIDQFSRMLVNASSATTFPFITFISAGIVNIFVPSGGGQWVIQGPIISEAAKELGIPLSKAVMALSYGDQLTNMLQPFWALPLLGITRLKAADLLPYTFVLFVAGFIIYGISLFIF